MTLPEQYRKQLAQLAACPIELGAIGALADNECTHGRLPGDPTMPCGCWPGESGEARMAAVLALARAGEKPATILAKMLASKVCGCGCGEPIEQRPGKGRTRRYVNDQHRHRAKYKPTGRPRGRPRKVAA